MKIVIESIPHAAHRYSTVGDYYLDADGVRHIVVSDLGGGRNARASMLLVVIHELIEMVLVTHGGLDERAIDEWDMAHPQADEPGDIPGAPYHRQHVFADCVERLLAQEMGFEWDAHQGLIEALFDIAREDGRERPSASERPDEENGHARSGAAGAVQGRTSYALIEAQNVG